MATLANPRCDTAIHDLPMNSTLPVLAEASIQTNDARGDGAEPLLLFSQVNRSILSKFYLKFLKPFTA
jgi:hypothetical protein